MTRRLHPGAPARAIGAGLALIAVLIAAMAAGMAVASAQSDDIEVIDVTATADEAVLIVATPEWLSEDGIGPGSFIVSVGGRVVTPEVEPLAGERLDIVLAIDVSGSMVGDPLAAAQRSATRFVRRMPDGARVSVVAFGDEPEVVTPFTQDRDVAVDAIDGLVAAGETSLHAAAVRSAELLGASDGVPLLILLSDGANTVESATMQEAAAALNAAAATVQVISIDSDEATPAELRTLVRSTSGSLDQVADVADLDSLYDGLAERLRNYYELTVPSRGASGSTQIVLRAAEIGERLGESATTSVVVPFAERSDGPIGDAGGLADVAAPDVTLSTPETVVADRGPDRLLRWGSIAAVGAGMLVLVLPSLLRRVRSRPAGRRHRPIQAYLGSQSDRSERGTVRGLVGDVGRRLSGRGPGGVLRRALERAGWQLRTTEFMLIVGGLLAFAVLIGALISTPFAIALALIVLAGVGAMLLIAASRRREEFERQLNGTLQMLAGALRAGYSLPQAFSFVGAEAPSPTGDEFNRIVLESRLGVDLIEAAQGTATRMQSEDFTWVVDATDIARDVGGDLAEVFDNVAATIRTRGQIARQVKTLSAEGRISAWILAILPVPLLLWQLAVNRDYTMLLFTTTMGLVIFVVSVALLVIGSLWMRSIVNVEY